MKNYTKKAFKITLSLFFLGFFSILFLIGSVKASPPYGYDFGRKQIGYHEIWWTVQWKLYTFLAVDYDDSEEKLIEGYTTTGSGAYDITAPWDTYGYSQQITVGGSSPYDWVKLSNSAYFERVDGSARGRATGWNRINKLFTFSGASSWTQAIGWRM